MQGLRPHPLLGAEHDRHGYCRLSELCGSRVLAYHIGSRGPHLLTRHVREAQGLQGRFSGTSDSKALGL